MEQSRGVTGPSWHPALSDGLELTGLGQVTSPFLGTDFHLWSGDSGTHSGPEDSMVLNAQPSLWFLVMSFNQPLFNSLLRLLFSFPIFVHSFMTNDKYGMHTHCMLAVREAVASHREGRTHQGACV
jgi:hypothetical protein